MNPLETGRKTEAIVLAELVKRDYWVSVPFGPQRYDLIVDRDGVFERVQVKTGRLRDGKVVYNPRSVSGRSRKARSYTKDEIDVFAVYCPETEKVYWVPVEDASASVAHLRIAPAKNGQSVGVRLANDYELKPT